MINSVKSLCPKNCKNLHFKSLKLYEEAARKFPSYFVAFDFVAFEEFGDLADFSDLVNEHFENSEDFEPTVSYHAGESFNRGNRNCLDAIQKGTRRLGHGLNLLRDPHAIDLAKQKGIVIEVCPLSNNLLGYVNDLNWHPAKFLKEMGVRIT